jgi:exodeoxyribonuclease VII small subunit
MAEEKLTYESAYAELEEIMNALKDDRIGVDELTGKVKRAAQLIAYCTEMLRSTEKEVTAVVKKLGL